VFLCIRGQVSTVQYRISAWIDLGIYKHVPLININWVTKWDDSVHMFLICVVTSALAMNGHHLLCCLKMTSVLRTNLKWWQGSKNVSLEQFLTDLYFLMRLLIMVLSPPLLHLPSLRSKYSPQHPCSLTPSIYALFLGWGKKSYTLTYKTEVKV
jgi:hypothetical protein